MENEKGTWASRERYLIRIATLDEAIRRIDGSTLYSLFEDSEKAFWHAKGINDALDILRQMRDEP